MRVYREKDGFGTVKGAYTYGRVTYYRVVWDRDPWFTDDVPQAEVEVLG